MIVYPTLQLMDGRCVYLRRGNLDQPVVWDVSPVEAALSFAQAGASWMHLTDFDAIEGRDTNADLVREIIRKVHIPVQLAGGFRTQDQIEAVLNDGAGRIVLGTVAVLHPDWARMMAKYHPDQIVLSVDIWKGQVMIDGWRTPCAIAPEALIESFAEAPLAAIKITDIDNDVDATEASLGVISGLAQHSVAPVIASGLVHTIDDISRLKYVPRISGFLLGHALVKGSVSLEEALAVAGAVRERTAEFI